MKGAVREERAHAGLSVSDWLTPNLRYAIVGGVDSWNRDDRTISIGWGLEQRLLRDRISVGGTAAAYAPLSGGAAFQAAAVNAAFLSSPEPDGWVTIAQAGFDIASARAPLALWSGAGDGRARTALLRAHPLLDGGIVAGDVFGRLVQHANVELQRWLPRPVLARIAVAGFIDAARADAGAASRNSPTRIDGGLGLRVRAPGREGTLRVDYAHGLRDGANAITVGWLIGLPGSSPR
jgi:hypothetical protein